MRNCTRVLVDATVVWKKRIIIILTFTAASFLHEARGNVAAGARMEQLQSADERLACQSGDSQPPTRQNTTARLARLRQEMAAANISAYIILDGDDHQSLFLAARDQRRLFVSGFSGSGDAVVTSSQAAVWTDSRYYTQADEQLDCNWLLMKTGYTDTPTIREWLAKELTAADVVSSDPRIATYTEWTSWESYLSGFNISLRLLSQNLVDNIWGAEESRPQYSNRSLTILSTNYTGATWQQKLAELRTEMVSRTADVLVVTALDDIAWALNLRGDENLHTPLFRAYLLVGAAWATLFLPAERATAEVIAHLQADNTDLAQAVRIRPYEDIWTALTDVGAEYSRVWLPSAYSYARGASYLISQAVPSEKRYFAESPALLKKALKNEVEARAMRQGHIKDAVALCQMLEILEEDIENGNKVWDELSVSQEIHRLRMAQEGYVGTSFGTIAAFGPHSAMAHYKPDESSNIVINKSSLFMFDSGGQYPGCTTDVTRTMHYGVPTQLQVEVYTRLLMGCIDLASTVFPAGRTMTHLEAVLRRPLYELGLDYGHGSTHGIGSFLAVHESFDQVYRESFFGSQEPGYYRTGEFGMRLENIVTVVKADVSDTTDDFSTTYLTFDPVTLVPYETKLINFTMMSSKQIQWLNAYHSRTREVVGAEMLRQGHRNTYEWLVRKTQPVTADGTSSGSSAAGTHYFSILLVLVPSVPKFVQHLF